MIIQTYSFQQLDTIQLYKLLKLRSEVFVVEQDCVYQDVDDKDIESYHVLMQTNDGLLTAYARLLPIGLSYPNCAAIGRVVTSPKMRGNGLGRKLMQFCIQEIKRLWPNQEVKLQAQSYLTNFYESLNFRVVSEEYLEDNIPHTAMVLREE